MGSAPVDFPPPPYELRSERLVVRCWRPTDAALIKDAIDTSLDHLRNWMPWARHEPQPLDAKVDLLRRFRGTFDLGTDFVYGIFDRDETRVLGGCGLHQRGGPRSLEIGYWVRADSVRQGIATEIVKLLAAAAFDVCGIERLDVLVEPGNDASAAIPRRLGFVEEGVLRRRLTAGEDEPLRDCRTFTMVVEEYRASDALMIDFEAFDAAGRPMSA